MRISELAGATGVPATTLRFYEQRGLLPARRTSGNYRDYDDSAVDRLSFIGNAQDLGLRLEEIGELLVAWDGGACRDVRAQLLPRLRERLGKAATGQDELRSFTTHLQDALQHLEGLPDRDGACDGTCSLPDEPKAPVADQTGSPAVACTLNGPAAAIRYDAWHSLLSGRSYRPVAGGWTMDLPLEHARPLVPRSGRAGMLPVPVVLHLLHPRRSPPDRDRR